MMSQAKVLLRILGRREDRKVSNNTKSTEKKQE
jgi:hypothetical protein